MKIGLVGTAETSRDIAPYEDKSWVFWGCGFWSADIRRFERWFEMHDLDGLPGCEQNCNILTQSMRPIMLQKDNPLIPTGVVYPIKAIVKRYGRRNLTSTVAYMFALAINHIMAERIKRADDHIGEIGLWGVEMIIEYELQRAGVEHFLDMCVFLRIPVFLPEGCSLRRTARLYAYETETATEKNHRKLIAKSENRIVELEEAGQGINTKTGYHHGVIDTLKLLGEGRPNGQ